MADATNGGIYAGYFVRAKDINGNTMIFVESGTTNTVIAVLPDNELGNEIAENILEKYNRGKVRL